MKILFTLIFVTISSVATIAQTTINVNISGFKNEDGKAMIGLYSSKDEFLKNVYKSFSAPIVDGNSKGSFKNVPEGTYAISVYHDENDNDKLDRFMGMMPSEDYGNSNNVRPGFGPPKWENAKFEIKDGDTVQIDIEMM